MLRLRRHLSAIINFAKFREEKLIAYSEMQASLEALAEERRVLEEAQAHMVGWGGWYRQADVVAA